MGKRGWRWLRLAWRAGLVGLACAALGASAFDTRTWDQKAADAIAIPRWEAAAKFTQNFIDGSVGDPRVDKMRKQEHECSLALAKEWTGEGREADAARLYLWIAQDGITPADQQAAMVKHASAIMESAMTFARQKHLAVRGLELQKEWTAIFPDKASPLTAADLEKMTTDGFLLACQDKLNLVALDDVVAQFYPRQAPAWDDLAKKMHGEGPLAGHFRVLAELGWAGRFLADYKALAADSALRSNQEFCNRVELMAVGRAQAWATQGNLGQTADAVKAAKDLVVTESKMTTLKTLEVKLAARPTTEPRELSFPGPVTGNVVWQDPGSGFVGKEEVVLDDDSDVSVKAGFVLTGGKFDIKRGRLRLQGTPTQPVVFRDVTINCESGARVEGENVLFIHCRFDHTGTGKFMGYSTKWTFSGCLFYRSQFRRLGQGSMGVHIHHSAWVEGTLPERVVLGDDMARTYRDYWNDLQNCLFLRTDLAATTLWMTDKSNFVRCTLTGGGQFDSKTPLQVNLFVPEADPMAVKLRADTMATDKGDVQYMFVRKAFDVGVPPLLWALLPVEGAEIPGKKGK